jgi:hypothetical protein
LSGHGVLLANNDKLLVNEHWFWGNWIVLSLMAAACFALCNLFIGELAPLGLAGNYYYNTGSLVYAIGFFIKKGCTKETIDY